MEVTTATYILAEATGSERPGKEATEGISGQHDMIARQEIN